MSSLALSFNNYDIASDSNTKEINHDLCNLYLLDNTDLSDTTIKSYKTYLKQFIIWLNKGNITKPTEDTIKEYKNYLKMSNSYTIATKNQYIRAVKHLFRWLSNRGLYPNIASNVKEFRDTKKHKRDSLTPSEINKIINNIGTTSEVDLRDRAIIILASSLGLRASEIINININDIEQKDNYYIVNIKGKGYQEKNTKKAIPKPVYQAIQDYLKVKKSYKPSDALFTSTAHRTLNNSDKRLCKETLSQIIKNRFRASGFNSSKLVLHSLRHLTADSTLKATDKNIYKTQQYLRHQSATTTEIYLTESDDVDINLANDVYNAIFNESELNKTKELKDLINTLDLSEVDQVLNYIKNIRAKEVQNG